MSTEAPLDHWVRHAHQWKHVGPPLRPCREDVACFERWAAEARRPEVAFDSAAVLLGVTPELAGMRWPPGMALTAVDRCPGMIGVVWPQDLKARQAQVVQSDWCNLPLADGGVDVVIGDGCYTPLEWPDGYERVTSEVRRVLRLTGRYIVRLFVRPARGEAVESVFTDLEQGRIGNFHVFKWRLAMAMHGTGMRSVRVGDIWQLWKARGIDVNDLARRPGWSINAVRTIDVYKDGEARYTFLTLDEMRAILQEHFSELACHVPSYELGERCPILLLAPRPRARANRTSAQGEGDA